MAIQLTRGAIQSIHTTNNADSVGQPIVQIIELKRIQATGSNPNQGERFRYNF